MKFTRIAIPTLVLAFGLASASLLAAQSAAPSPSQQGKEAWSGEGEHSDGQYTESGSVDQRDSENGGDMRDAVPDATPAIDMAQAQKAAEAYAKSGKAVSVKLEDENGKLVYSVIVARHDVKVDAMTGVVLGSGQSEEN
jgi:uncharacterized membrane protein YkoI